MATERLLGYTCTAFLFISSIQSTPIHAQSREICDRPSEYEPAAETTRTIELSNFNVAVNIPANFRTMGRQDGSVEILHPNDFDWLQCIARGGLGASGYYFERIQQVAPDPSLNLRSQAIQRMGGNSTFPVSATPYEGNGIEGYVVASPSGYGVSFLGTVPGSTQLLEVQSGCDCEVDPDWLLELLSRISPLQ